MPAKSAMTTIASAKIAPTITTVLRASRRRLFVSARSPAAAWARSGSGPQARARRVVAWSYKVTVFDLQAKSHPEARATAR
jgi:hypothetical protein